MWPFCSFLFSTQRKREREIKFEDPYFMNADIMKTKIFKMKYELKGHGRSHKAPLAKLFPLRLDKTILCYGVVA